MEIEFWHMESILALEYSTSSLNLYHLLFIIVSWFYFIWSCHCQRKLCGVTGVCTDRQLLCTNKIIDEDLLHKPSCNFLNDTELTQHGTLVQVKHFCCKECLRWSMQELIYGTLNNWVCSLLLIPSIASVNIFWLLMHLALLPVAPFIHPINSEFFGWLINYMIIWIFKNILH
jgi:hypothetical protein